MRRVAGRVLIAMVTAVATMLFLPTTTTQATDWSYVFALPAGNRIAYASPGKAAADGEIPFGAGVVITDTANSVRSVYAADMDGDGDVDVLSASWLDNKIAWYENDGGSFPAFTGHVITTASNGAESVYAADVDGDGDIDVLSASWNDNKIAWYENDGTSFPTFTSHVITTTADRAASVYAADVDSDGDLDVLSASYGDDKIAWYENDGVSPPTFTDHVITTASAGAIAVYAADVDDDGDLDVLSASISDDKIAWYENVAGDGSAFTSHVITTTADGANAVYATDVDGDGDIDVLSASRFDDKVVWHENTMGDGSAFTGHAITTTADRAASVYAADVDNDGDMDVLSASFDDDKIAWYENDGDSPPAFTSHVITTSADAAYSVHTADVDGDGDLDVLSASSYDNRIVWYPNQTIHRSALYPVQTVITTNADWAFSVYAADVDGDGDTDVLSASMLDDKIAWYENDGDSPPIFTSHVIATTADGANSVYAADVDGDGDMDVLSTAYYGDKITWYENHGSAPPTFTSHNIPTTADGASSVYAADVDGDGDMDVLSTSWYDNKIAWYENDGASPPAFTSHNITTNAIGANSVYAADVDGDGDLDVLAASQEDDKIAWYENQGGSSPAFTSHVITTSADAACSVYAADVDGDVDLDVLSASWLDDKIAWYENDGTSPPTFTPHVITTSADGTGSVYAADVDNDGDLDVLSASANDDKIAWYENDGGASPAFTFHVITTIAHAARSVHAADVDGDGDLDVLSASYDDDKIAWYENRGGQFALTTTDTAPTTILEGKQDDLLRIVATHRGRAGDTDAELAALDLLFEESVGDPLTTAEVNALIKNLHIYLDDGSGAFESAQDTLIITVGSLSLSDGHQTVIFADGDSSVRVAHGTPRTYFVVAELTGNAADQTPNQFRVMHVTDPSGSGQGSVAEDRDHDLPLTLEFAPDVTSSVVTVVGAAGDDYEDDDTCDVANTIATDGSHQTHMFHYAGDQDWIKFTVEANKTYVIETSNVGADHDAILFLYDACGAPDLESEDNAFGQTVRIEWNSTSAGTFYLMLQQYDPTIYGESTRYDISVELDTTPPSAPKNLRSAPADEALIFQWKRSPELDVVEYEICYSTESTESGECQGYWNVEGGDTTYYEGTGLTNGTRYYARVRAFDFSHNPSLWTSEISNVPEIPQDATNPSVTVNQPTTAAVYTTTLGAVTIGGNAQDTGENLSRVEVRKGTDSLGWDYSLAGGSDTFYVENVSLSLGDNTIQVIAHDDAGNEGSTTLTFHRLGQTDDGVVIIVAGHNGPAGSSSGGGLQSNIYNAANHAYRVFQGAGFSDDAIYYLSPSAQAPYGDGNNKVDGTATPANLQYAITNWAVASGRVGSGQPLHLYMMDHGETEYFCTDGCGSSGQTMSNDLDSWLDTLESSTGADTINVIIEACRSGSFIDRVEGEAASISEAGRVVIASTGRNNNAYASTEGAYFSDAFFSCVVGSGSLKTCYDQAKAAVALTGNDQTPWLDDNGDGLASPIDGSIAQNRYIASAFGSFQPEIQSASVDVVGGSGTLTASVEQGAEEIDMVWAAVYSPSFQEPVTTTLNLGVPVVLLEADPEEEGSYTATYPSGFTEEGPYRVIFYAQDLAGTHAPPKMVTPGETRVYLPVVVRN